MESALIAVLRSMTICGLQDGYERVAASERQDVSADDRAILGVCGTEAEPRTRRSCPRWSGPRRTYQPHRTALRGLQQDTPIGTSGAAR